MQLFIELLITILQYKCFYNLKKKIVLDIFRVFYISVHGLNISIFKYLHFEFMNIR